MLLDALTALKIGCAILKTGYYNAKIKREIDTIAEKLFKVLKIMDNKIMRETIAKTLAIYANLNRGSLSEDLKIEILNCLL